MRKNGDKMNKMVSEVFKLLDVEPNEKFRIRDASGNVSVFLYFDEKLYLRFAENGWLSTNHLVALLNGQESIVKENIKKLRDWTLKDMRAYTMTCSNCSRCPFRYITCTAYNDECWVNNKDMFSDEFLDKEVKIPKVNHNE